jgi:hypothetical protein
MGRPGPPFAVVICLHTWNNPVIPLTTSKDSTTCGKIQQFVLSLTEAYA